MIGQGDPAGSDSYLVSGRAFVGHYGIDDSSPRQFNARSYGEGTVGFSVEEDEIVS